jgi:hypothetical protein
VGGDVAPVEFVIHQLHHIDNSHAALQLSL